MSGLSEYGRQTALAALIPNDTTVHVALLTTLPTSIDGTGLVEATAGGYAREMHDAWTNETDGDDVIRKNGDTVDFDALTADQDGVVGWALYDSNSGGNLLAYGPIVDSNDDAISQDFEGGDEPRFAIGVLKIIIRG